MNNKLELKDIKENAIYRYLEGAGWCKHGIVYTYMKDGKLYARDTYDDSKFENEYSEFAKRYKVENIYQDLEYVMLIEEAEQVDKDKFYEYDEHDRILIPMGDWHERWLVNKNKEPRKDYQIERLEWKINDLEWEVQHGQEKLIELKEKLKELKGE